MKPKLYFLLALIGSALLVRLFFGVYIHDEFGDTEVFVKHRPVWKWEFRSYLGSSDLDITDLSPEQQTEQRYFDEFVKNRGLSR